MFDSTLNHARAYRLLIPVLLAVFPLVSLLTACGGGGTTTTPTPSPTSQPLPAITITAKDYSFEMPNSLPAGLVAITLINAGTQPHQATLAQLRPGVTPDHLLAVAK